MRQGILLALLFSSFVAYSQAFRGLVAHYTFENCVENNEIFDASGNGASARVIGNPTCNCGIRDNSLDLRAASDQVLFLSGPVYNLFNKRDFSVSFYFKPAIFSGTRSIMYKKDECATDQYFDIKFTSGSNRIQVDLVENASKFTSAIGTLPFGRCWYHIVAVRAGNRTRLYIDGELAQEVKAVSRVDISNNSVLTVGGSTCQATNDAPFIGSIDEIRIYDRALEQSDIDELFLAPDRIATKDTTVFLGNDVQIRLTETCATRFSWTPGTDIDDPSAKEPLITPTTSTTYMLSMDDNFCVAFDSIRINVVDPMDLNCKEVFLPKAFTPNGDGLNDMYGISNPYAVRELISLEIYDRWGGRVFFTDDPFERWDGSLKGQAVNPGVMLYRVRFICDGQEEVSVGSLSILR